MGRVAARPAKASDELSRRAQVAARVRVNELRRALDAEDVRDIRDDEIELLRGYGSRLNEALPDAGDLPVGLPVHLARTLARTTSRLRSEVSPERRAALEVEASKMMAFARRQPLDLLSAICGDFATSIAGPCWLNRRPTDRELGLVAVLAGWTSSSWAPGMTDAELLARATDAVRHALEDERDASDAARARRGLTPSRRRAGRPKRA